MSNNYSLRRGKATTPTLQRSRTFDLQLSLAPYNDIVLDVLNSIEIDRLMVLDGDQKGALSETFKGDKEINLSAHTKKSASIHHWLAAGCQVIRWDDGEEFAGKDHPSGALAFYRNNASTVLYPIGTCHTPPGPSAFLGEIVCNTDLRLKLLEGKVSPDYLRFIIAHELTHVFDALRLLVPAFRNWQKFWRNVLEEGDCCEDALLFSKNHSTFVDDYGSDNELKTVKLYWHSRAEEWFAAMRGNRK